jgi:hypothetical protein
MSFPSFPFPSLALFLFLSPLRFRFLLLSLFYLLLYLFPPLPLSQSILSAFFLNLTLNTPYSQSPSRPSTPPLYFSVSVVIPKVCKVVRIEVEYMYQLYIQYI